MFPKILKYLSGHLEVPFSVNAVFTILLLVHTLYRCHNVYLVQMFEKHSFIDTKSNMKHQSMDILIPFNTTNIPVHIYS